MDMPDETLLEDWQGLESEMERLLIVYGYPTESDVVLRQREVDPETQAIISEPQSYDAVIPHNHASRQKFNFAETRR